MSDKKCKNESTEEKFNKYKKDIQNDRMFLFKINQILNDEYEELLEDIILLNEKQFMSELKNRTESELENIYSDKIFSEKKFNNVLEKGLNSIKTDYITDHQLLNHTYNNYTKNKNSKNSNIEFLINGYRRHCRREVDNEFATHICKSNLGKFILVKSNGKVEYVICSNCKKVYYSSMILCKCYQCNKEYYTELLPKTEDEFLLPATWENYHCKQICNEKIQCIKCQEPLYINLKTGMLNCLNKKCNFVSKASKILWICSICKEEFRSGAIPYNPLDLEIIKKIIKQTLFQKQKAHPSNVPCCKINVFFTEFYHKKKCNGILYTGEYNDDIIVLCEKCRAINFIDRFIWTCPKCGNKFKDEKNEKDSSVNEEKEEFDTINLNETKKSDKSANNNNSNNNNKNNINDYPNSRNKKIYLGFIKRSFLSSNRSLDNLENNNNQDFKNLNKNNNEFNIKKTKLNINENYTSEKYSSTIEPPSPSSFKKIYNSKLNQNNKINENNNKEKSLFNKSNNNNKNIEDDKMENNIDKKLSKFKRIRFHTVNDLNMNKKKKMKNLHLILLLSLDKKDY